MKEALIKLITLLIIVNVGIQLPEWFGFTPSDGAMNNPIFIFIQHYSKIFNTVTVSLVALLLILAGAELLFNHETSDIKNEEEFKIKKKKFVKFTDLSINETAVVSALDLINKLQSGSFKESLLEKYKSVINRHTIDKKQLTAKDFKGFLSKVNECLADIKKYDKDNLNEITILENLSNKFEYYISNTLNEISNTEIETKKKTLNNKDFLTSGKIIGNTNSQIITKVGDNNLPDCILEKIALYPNGKCYVDENCLDDNDVMQLIQLLGSTNVIKKIIPEARDKIAARYATKQSANLECVVEERSFKKYIQVDKSANGETKFKKSATYIPAVE